MDIEAEAQQLVTSIPERDDLRLPNYKFNIFKVMPTLLSFLGYQFPGYQSLSELPEHHTVFQANDCYNNENVVHLVVDSIGFKPMLSSHEFLNFYKKSQGQLISSVFPTITSSALSSIFFGCPPVQHGILGHQIFFSEVGDVVDTLTASTSSQPEPNSLLRGGYNPNKLVWSDPISKYIKNEGIPSFSLFHYYIAHSGLGQFFLKDSTVVGFHGLIDSFSIVKRILERFKDKKTLINIYIGVIDWLSHRYGPMSRENLVGFEELAKKIWAFVEELPRPLAESTVLSLSADHGHNTYDHNKTIKFTSSDIKEIGKNMSSVPGHSGRVIHLYTKKGRKETVKKWMTEKIGDFGIVLDFERIRNNFLSKTTAKSDEELRVRIGDLLVLLGDGGNIQVEREDNEEPIFSIPQLSSHGSTTLEELVIPFITSRIDHLQ